MIAASHGGAGAIAVFAVFVVAFAVLIGFVVRFAQQQARRDRARRQLPGSNGSTAQEDRDGEPGGGEPPGAQT